MRKEFFKIVTLSILIHSTLFSSTYFDDGLQFFEKKDYTNAYKVFHQLFTDGNYRDNLDFYLGRSAFEVQKYNEALFAFDRVLIETENQVKIDRVKLELARTHLALGEKETAKKIFQEVLDNNPPKSVRIKIQLILNSQKKEVVERGEWNIFANLETGFETNINSQPSKEDMVKYIDNPEIEPEDSLDSVYFQEMGNIGYTYNFDDSGVILNSNLFAYNQNYIDNSDYDISYFSFGFSSIYKEKNYKVEMPFKVEYVGFGGKELLTAFTLGLKGSKYIETKFIKAVLFDVFANYKSKVYDEVNSEQDSTVFEYGLSLTTKYQKHLFNLRYSTEQESAENYIEANINQTDKIINSVKVKYVRAKVLDYFNLSLNYSFRNIVYEDYRALTSMNVESTEGCRNDKFHSFKIGFEKDINKNLSINTAVNFIVNESNHVPSDYDKEIYNLGLNYIF